MNSAGLYAYNYYLGKGYSPAAAAGIVGNLHAESNFNPNASGDNGTAYGLGQWRFERLDNLKKYAADTGQDYRSLDAQLGFVDHEMRTGSDAGAGRAYQALQNAQDPTQAAQFFMQNYERPNADPRINNIAGRSSFANQIAGVDPSTLPTQSPMVADSSGIASLPNTMGTATAVAPTVSAAPADPMAGVFGLLLQGAMTPQVAPAPVAAPQPVRMTRQDDRTPEEKLAAVSQTPNVYLDMMRRNYG